MAFGHILGSLRLRLGGLRPILGYYVTSWAHGVRIADGLRPCLGLTLFASWTRYARILGSLRLHRGLLRNVLGSLRERRRFASLMS